MRDNILTWLSSARVNRRLDIQIVESRELRLAHYQGAQAFQARAESTRRCLISWIEREESIEAFVHTRHAAVRQPNDGGGHLHRQTQAERAQIRSPRLLQVRDEVIGQRLHQTPIVTADRLRGKEARSLLALL